MNKQTILRKLEQAWEAFTSSFAGLSADQLQTPGVVDDWSVKDLIAHVSLWEEEALKHLPMVLQGGRPPRYSTLYGGIDAFNARMTKQTQSLSLDIVLQQADKTHQQLIAYVQSVSDDQFTTETRFIRRLRLDTYRHYPIHTKAIQEWRQKLLI